MKIYYNIKLVRSSVPIYIPTNYNVFRIVNILISSLITDDYSRHLVSNIGKEISNIFKIIYIKFLFLSHLIHLKSALFF